MMFSQWPYSHRIFKRLANALIRLHVCAGWSEPLLVTQTTLMEILCCGSNVGADLSSRDTGSNFGLSLHLQPYFVYTSSESSGKSAHLCLSLFA